MFIYRYLFDPVFFGVGSFRTQNLICICISPSTLWPKVWWVTFAPEVVLAFSGCIVRTWFSSGSFYLIHVTSCNIKACIITYLFRVWIERMPFILRVSVLYFWRGVATSSHWLVCIYSLSQLPSWVALCRQFRGMLAYEPGRLQRFFDFTSKRGIVPFLVEYGPVLLCRALLEPFGNPFKQLQPVAKGTLRSVV